MLSFLLRFINSINRKNLTYKLKPNKFADMTEEEYNLHKGSLPDNPEELKRQKRTKPVLYINEKYRPHRKSPKIPDQLDWRKYGMHKIHVSSFNLFRSSPY